MISTTLNEQNELQNICYSCLFLFYKIHLIIGYWVKNVNICKIKIEKKMKPIKNTETNCFFLEFGYLKEIKKQI